MTALERWLFWVTGAATTLTGLVYFWMKYLMEGADPYSAVHHPLQPLMLKLHIISAPFLVFALGMVTARHVWPRVTERVALARRSGMASALVAGPMVVTGYLVQVFTDERWLVALGWGHFVTGLAFAAGALVHRVLGRGNGGRNGG